MPFYHVLSNKFIIYGTIVYNYMQPIIIGLDPGTTSAFAALSVDFKVLMIKSRKDYPLNDIISDVSKIGIPIIVGTDKKDLPGMIKEFSQKTGAKIHLTRYDTKKDEKKVLVKKSGFNDLVNNAHEIDSLAAAIYAYNDYRSLFDKIEKFIQLKNKPELKDKLILKVILEEKSIKSALFELEKKPEKKIAPIAKTIPERRYPSKEEAEIERLKERILELEEESEELREQNKLLLEKRIDINAETKKIISFKEQRALGLERQYRRLRTELKEKEMIIGKLNVFIAEAGRKIILKVLKDLSLGEYQEKKSILKISKGDILYVRDLSSYSRNVIDELKKKCEIIIYDKGTPLHDFICLKNDFSMQKNRYFALMEKDDLEDELSKTKKSKTYLKDILDEYKKERLKEII